MGDRDWQRNGALFSALITQCLQHTKDLRRWLIHHRHWQTAQQHWDPAAPPALQHPNPQQFSFHSVCGLTNDEDTKDTKDTKQAYLLTSMIVDTLEYIAEKMASDVDCFRCRPQPK
jgi:hypothetical protein